MKPAVVTAVLAVMVGCSFSHGHANARTKTERIVVERPTIVGFFPAVTESDVEADAGVNSALEHWEWALENAQRCFGPKGVHVQAVLADKVVIETDGQIVEAVPRLGATADIGYYLLAPGRAPELVMGPAPSSLLYFLPKAASEYFAVPECAPEAMR